LELGTGLGLISALCASNQLVESVLTVEANPQLIGYIRRLHATNNLSDKIEVRNAVAMPKPGAQSMKFYRRADLWASSLDSGPWGYEEEIDVPTLDLNHLIAEFNPTLLIVDIEGGERGLFDEIDLGTTRKVMMELHQNVIGRRAMKSVFDALSARNFHYDQWHSSHNVVTFSHIDRE
jgi:FkbM family methyltransferase